MTTRRLFFTGSAAALATVPVGYTLLAQQRRSPPSDPLTRELHRQLRQGVQALRANDASGAYQVANTLRVYAAALPDLRADAQRVVKQRGRRALTTLPVNHSELEKMAEEVGFPTRLLPPHEPTGMAGREQGLDRFLAEGHAPLMLQIADAIEPISRMKGGGVIRPIARVRHQDQEPEQDLCFTCDDLCNLIEPSGQLMAVACALAAAFPPAAPLCAASSMTFLSTITACMACEVLRAMFSNC
jgi:hypothetical protein